MAEFNPGQSLLDLPVENVGNQTLSSELGNQRNAPVSQDISAVAGWLAGLAQAFGVTVTEVARAAAEDPDSIAALGDKGIAEGLITDTPVKTPASPDLVAQAATPPPPNPTAGYVPSIVLPVPEAPVGGEGPGEVTDDNYTEPVAATTAPGPAEVAAASSTGGQAPADILSGIKMPLGPQGGPPPAGAAAPRPQLQPSELDALIGAVMAKSGAAGQAGLTLGTQLRR